MKLKTHGLKSLLLVPILLFWFIQGAFHTHDTQIDHDQECMVLHLLYETSPPAPELAAPSFEIAFIDEPILHAKVYIPYAAATALRSRAPPSLL